MLTWVVTQLLLELGSIGSGSCNQLLEITTSVQVDLSPNNVSY